MNPQEAALQKFLAEFDMSMPTNAEWEALLVAMEKAIRFNRNLTDDLVD